MESQPLLAGVDVGTTSTKAGVYETTGRAVSSAVLETPARTSAPGRVEHDAGDLWGTVVAALRRAVGALDDPRRVVGVAVASMAEAGVALDRDGEPAHAVVAWHDRRAAAQAERLASAVGAHRVQAITGLRPQPIYGLCKLAWLAEHHPDAFARTDSWLNIADYVAYRLCGERATDYSLASRTWALDLRSRTWSHELLDAAGVPARLLPPLVTAGTALGRVRPDAARDTGLPTHAIVAAGGHDHVCGALGAGVTDPGRALDSIGTAESLLLPLRAPLDVVAPRCSQGAHVVADRWYAATGIHAGGASIDWAVRVLGGGADRERLLAAAAAVPPGSDGVRYAPHLALHGVVEGAPGALVGLDPRTDAPTLVRAVIEGLAVAAHDALDGLVRLAGLAAPPEVRVIGGGARNALLLGVKAAVAARTLHRPAPAEATALGAALLSGVGAGVFAHASAAANAVDRDVEEIPCDPELVAAYRRQVVTLRALQSLAAPSPPPAPVQG